MRLHVAFTPAEAVSAPVGVVVDVMRATSTIVQALSSGYERVLCARGVEEARAVLEAVGEGLLGGERDAKRIEGFDVGASPRDFRDGHGETLILSTTNGTRALVRLDGQRTDAAVAAGVIAAAFPEAIDGIKARTYGPPGLEEDIAWVSQVNLLDAVPRFTRLIDGAAEIRVRA